MIARCCRDNMFNINCPKSRLVISTSPKKSAPGTSFIFLDSNTLPAVDQATFLGLDPEKPLKFQLRVSALALKAPYGIRALVRVRPHFSSRILISLSYPLLRGLNSYCISA